LKEWGKKVKTDEIGMSKKSMEKQHQDKVKSGGLLK